ncbi:hypothetical protein CH063_06083, partial [Colletotrichum higginsianum]
GLELWPHISEFTCRLSPTSQRHRMSEPSLMVGRTPTEHTSSRQNISTAFGVSIILSSHGSTSLINTP